MTETKTEVVEPVPNAGLQLRKSAEVIPAHIERGNAGREHITMEDMLMPRLSLAQKMSPEVDPTHEKYIDGLKVGQMFNSVTQEVYGGGPLVFAIVKVEPPRGVEFNPREKGGGVKDPNVPLTDPRMEWTSREGKDGTERVKPIATLFRDYIILLNLAEPMALSFKSTGIKVAKQLNSFIQLRGTNVYTGLYKIEPTVAQSANGPYYAWKVRNAGFVPPEEIENVKILFQALSNRDVVIDRGTVDADAPGDASEPVGNTPF